MTAEEKAPIGTTAPPELWELWTEARDLVTAWRVLYNLPINDPRVQSARLDEIIADLGIRSMHRYQLWAAQNPTEAIAESADEEMVEDMRARGNAFLDDEVARMEERLRDTVEAMQSPLRLSGRFRAR